MTSDDDRDMIAEGSYSEGSVTVSDDFDNRVVVVSVDGVVSFTKKFRYSDSYPDPDVDDARGEACDEARTFAKGVVRTLREEHDFPEDGEGL